MYNFSISRIGKYFSRCTLTVPFSKKGLHVKPKITFLKRKIMYSEFVENTSLNHRNLTKLRCSSDISICKKACFTSATIPIFPVRNLIRIPKIKGQKGQNTKHPLCRAHFHYALSRQILFELSLYYGFPG